MHGGKTGSKGFAGQNMLVKDPLTKAIIGAAIEVHRIHGHGLLESAYEACLCRELELRGLGFTIRIAPP